MMATSNVPLTRMSELVKCPICLEYYDDPRLLPCSHTFCFTCITQLAKHNDDEDGDHRFVCPLKDGTSLTQDELADLPVNRIVQNMVELLSPSCSNTNEQDQKQVHCDLCSENVGERWCIMCAQQYCGKCDLLHNTTFLHTTVPVAERTSCACCQHENEMLKFWCTQCKLLLCSVCLSNDDQHSRHNDAIEPMSNVVQGARNQIETCLQQLNFIELSLSAISQRTATVIRKQEENFETSLDQLNSRFHWLNNLIEERREELTSELEDHQAVTLSRLHHVTTRVREQLHRTKDRTLSSRHTLETGNVVQLLKASEDLIVFCNEEAQGHQELVSSCTTDEANFVDSLKDKTTIEEKLKVFGEVKRSATIIFDSPVPQQMIISQPNTATQRFYTGSFVFGYRFRLTQPTRLKFVWIQSTFVGDIMVNLYDEEGNNRKQALCQSINNTFKWNRISMKGVELRNCNSLLVWSNDQQGSIGYQQGTSFFRPINANFAVAGVYAVKSGSRMDQKLEICPGDRAINMCLVIQN